MLVVGAVIVVGGIIMFTAGRQSGSPGTASVSGVMQDKNQAPTSLKALFALGTSQKCTFSNSTDVAQSSGEVYVTSGKMRGDFSSVAAGQTVQSHMIVDKDTSYVWTNATNQGFKMSFENMTMPKSETTAKQTVDLNQSLDYSCNAWSPDESLFNLPAGISFNSMTDMMKGLAPTGSLKAAPTVPSGNSGQCGVCDQVPDPTAKAQCKAALGCK